VVNVEYVSFSDRILAPKHWF